MTAAQFWVCFGIASIVSMSTQSLGASHFSPSHLGHCFTFGSGWARFNLLSRGQDQVSWISCPTQPYYSSWSAACFKPSAERPTSGCSGDMSVPLFSPYLEARDVQHAARARQRSARSSHPSAPSGVNSKPGAREGRGLLQCCSILCFQQDRGPRIIVSAVCSGCVIDESTCRSPCLLRCCILERTASC